MDTELYKKVAVEMRETARKNGKMSVCVELSDWIGEMINETPGGIDVGYLTAMKDVLDKVEGIIEKINS